MDRSGMGRLPVDGYILIQARSADEASELARLVTRVPGVIEAHRVRGPYDVIAEVREPRDLRIPPAARAIGKLDGVLRAIPLAIASRVAASTGSDGAAA